VLHGPDVVFSFITLGDPFDLNDAAGFEAGVAHADAVALDILTGVLGEVVEGELVGLILIFDSDVKQGMFGGAEALFNQPAAIAPGVAVSFGAPYRLMRKA